MTREEILTGALALFRKNFRTDDPTGSMTAARAGILFRRAFPTGLEEGGFSKFSDLLRALAERGEIRTGKDSKNVLAIWMPEGVPFRSLRDEIWTGFVSSRPVGNRYINRLTGEVRLGLDKPPPPPEQWVQIQPLSNEIQKAWAEEFVHENGVATPEVIKALANEPWYFHFGEAIRQQPEASRQWRRLRSERVFRYVNDWCRANAIDPAMIYETARNGSSNPRLPSHSTSPETSPSSFAATHGVPGLGSNSLRCIVFDALSQMTLDELLAIPIPGKYFLTSLGSTHVKERQ